MVSLIVHPKLGWHEVSAIFCRYFLSPCNETYFNICFVTLTKIKAQNMCKQCLGEIC